MGHGNLLQASQASIDATDSCVPGEALGGGISSELRDGILSTERKSRWYGRHSKAIRRTTCLAAVDLVERAVSSEISSPHNRLEFGTGGRRECQQERSLGLILREPVGCSLEKARGDIESRRNVPLILDRGSRLWTTAHWPDKTAILAYAESRTVVTGGFVA